MKTREQISSKFENNDIPSAEDFGDIFGNFVHKQDKADMQMANAGLDDEHYITPAHLRVCLQNIGIITGNSYMPHKENFEDSFSGTILDLRYSPIPNSVKVFKNGQLLQEGPDYTLNFDMQQIKFLETVSDRNLEVDYWYKNLSPNPGSGSATAIDFTSFLHTSGNETKTGLLTFNNTTATSTSGIILKNSGAAAAATSLDVTNSGSGSGISLQNSSNGTGFKLSNAGTGVAVNVNSAPGSTGDILQVSKNNTVQTKIDSEGNVTAPKFVTSGGTRSKFVKGDGFLDPTVYAEDTKVIHTTGNESKDGALTLINSSPQDVLTIEKNDDANCLKLVQNSNSSATTSTWDTSTINAGRKAISIQKQGDEYAFITHDGDVTARSFSTTKANLTDDGLFSLANRPSPESSEGKAKLYAKNDGTDTHMYVMGSDGVEKKIGGVVDLSGKENTIAPGTTAQYYRGDKSWQTLDKTVVGLTNVDNTSDLNKPISTATQTALNLKANLASPSLTGTPTAPTAAAGTNTTQIATTAFVLANASTPDATTAVIGKVKLAGDLGGTADLPTVPALANKANLASPSFTGVPTAPTTTAGNNSTAIATTAYVDTNTIHRTGDESKTGVLTFTNSGPGTLSGLNLINNSVNGRIFLLQNNSSSFGIQLTNTSTGYGIYTDNNSTGTGQYIGNSSTGDGLLISSHGAGGNGIRIGNTTTGTGLRCDTSAGGNGILSNVSLAGFGYAYVGQNNGATTFSVNKTGNVTGASFIKSGGTNLQYLMADGSVTTSTGTSAEPSQITITTAVSITTDTLDANSKKQLGKNVIINNGASAINITVNGGTDFCASYLKHGAGAITFVQASGRTLIQVNATAILNGAVGSTATISSIGTTDYLRISNI